MRKPFIFRLHEADKGDNPQVGTSPAETSTTVTEPAKTEKTFTQADVDKIVSERLEREKRKATDAANKAKEEAEQKALAEQGEWKTLAEKYQGEIQSLTATLESQKAHEKTIERLTSVLKSRLETDRKGLPEPILKLLDRLDVADQMEWLASNPDMLKSAKDQTVGTPPRSQGSKGQPTSIQLPERRKITI